MRSFSVKVNGASVEVTRLEWLTGGACLIHAAGYGVDVKRVVRTQGDAERFADDVCMSEAGMDEAARRNILNQLPRVLSVYGSDLSNNTGTGVLDLVRRAEYILRQIPEDEATGWSKIHQDFLRDLRAGIDRIHATTIKE